MREIFLTGLIKEILGPRTGLREVLTSNPLDEYITGVLAPANARLPVADTDAESGKPPGEDAQAPEEQEPEPEIVPPALLAPVLNPQHRPRSIGLSFCIQVDQPGQPFAVNVCVTWARYIHDHGGWRRQPRIAVIPRLEEPAVLWLDTHGHRGSQQDAEISIHLLVRSIGPDQFLLTTHLVNRIQLPTGHYPSAEHHIFQPQIRVSCATGTRIIHGLDTRSQAEDDRELAFLYRDRPLLARGHLCSAVWARIDPEHHGEQTPPDFPECANEPPFYWLDGELAPDDVRQQFSMADVRTQFVPIYALAAPELEWPGPWGDPPELRAEELSELWDHQLLRTRLQPLPDGYRRWIDQLHNDSRNFRGNESEIARRLISRCETVARRLERGILRLVDDADARLAFCFAMKAMALQASWPTTGQTPPLTWHPFQLAFILIALDSIADPGSPERELCDLLWVPTGAGKTEAYLALAAFSLTYRRRRALRRATGDRTGAGVGVISRYTLRLLSIQQFRRTVKMVSACEHLRVLGLANTGPVGWRPRDCSMREDFIWGTSRFSAGLWVGGSVTPNRLGDTWGGQPVPGALTILRSRAGSFGQGEPAQILRCPVCEAILSVPQQQDKGLPPGDFRLHLTIQGTVSPTVARSLIGQQVIRVIDVEYMALPQQPYGTLTIRFSSAQDITAEVIETWWQQALRMLPSIRLMCARASRPGYFIRSYQTRNQPKEYDFEIFCPSPECALRHPWCEGAPLGWICGNYPHATSPSGGVGNVPNLPDRTRLACVNTPFATNSPYISDRIPVPALTVDEQVYHRCPSVVIATVDKFARPPFEPRAAGLFGNVTHHHCIHGYYREGSPPVSTPPNNGHPSPIGTAQARRTYEAIPELDPPDLVLQDELHLIEGPLGSLVGLYETAVDHLIRESTRHPVKYIASTATVRQAEEQVTSVFNRRLQTFPPPGLTMADQFFIRFSESHPLDDRRPGRLYMGICAPGRGPLTPIVRIWSRLLEIAMTQHNHPRIDPFWTLAGYFNAIRELAGARALYRQDIPERLRRISTAMMRPLPDDRSQELSGRTHSTELPMILDLLNQSIGLGAQDALFTTSMFGTGVDIPRIGLMVVHGQPKTTSAYIQATGRVGRRQGALVPVFLRASRPRDLNHYEFFNGYHRQLHRFVEPVTVMPFAPGALVRAIGPVGVFILRNQRRPAIRWHEDVTAAQMSIARHADRDVLAVPGVLESRAQAQPTPRRPDNDQVGRLSRAALDTWQQVAGRRQANLEYVEWVITNPPQFPVVLGDPPHQRAGLDVVYENAPQSLRDIEETSAFET